MRIAVLFDGGGLARLGLERAGHTCTGFELDPIKHYFSLRVGSGNAVLADVRDVDLRAFDAVWASPPCQFRSQGRTQGEPVSAFAMDLLDWSLAIDTPVLWVENVMGRKTSDNQWGRVYNAAQFSPEPLQNRNRIIGGRYTEPGVFHQYRKKFEGVCPCITATEYKGCATDTRRASRFYGRRLTVQECAYHQGFDIPQAWFTALPGFTEAQWRNQIYEAIGNGVPVYMAEAFGMAARNAGSGYRQLSMWTAQEAA